ncbi:MAG: glycogen/starch/alpha-glucan phosphorylase, partial [Eubacteriales bacterium]|nr:glycogen/starch/alpha-glucan phosphorylase [Eubacteriales bacterium]
MNEIVDRIIYTTETILKCRHDESLMETNAARLHDCLGEAVMLAITEQWSACRRRRAPLRKAYYFSAEYLIGRLIYSNLYNLGILEEMRTAFAQRGVDLAMLEEVEDAALGNGGLGRLAACFLDSAATLNLPLSGYGLRYRFGLFKQRFE